MIFNRKARTDSYFINEISPHKSVFNRLIFVSLYKGKALSLEYDGCLSNDVLCTLKAIKEASLAKVLWIQKHVRIDPIVRRSQKRKKERIVIRIDECAATLRLIIPYLVYRQVDAHIYGNGSLAKRPIIELLYALREQIDYMHFADNDHYNIIIRSKVSRKAWIGNLPVPTDKSSQFFSSLALLSISEENGPLVLTTPDKKQVSENYIKCSIAIARSLNISILSNKRERYVFFMNRRKYWKNTYWIDTDCNIVFFLGALSTLSKIELSMQLHVGQFLLPEWQYLFDFLFKRIGINFKYDEKIQSLTIDKSQPHVGELLLRDHIEYLCTLSVLALYSKGISCLYGIEHSRYHESNRINTLLKAFHSIGHKDLYYENGALYIGEKRGKLSGTIDVSGDHRMALFALLLSAVEDSVEFNSGQHSSLSKSIGMRNTLITFLHTLKHEAALNPMKK
jgi:3-phosphoshikimate 1-carboxyvinyltransferase